MCIGDSFKEVKVLSINTYQIPHLISLYFKLFDRSNPAGKNCCDQKKRMLELIKLIMKNDICCLQEVWGENHYFLYNSIKESYNTPQLYVPWNEFSKMNFMSNIWNSYKCFIKDKTGGLFTAIRNELPIIWTHHHRFYNCNGEEILNKSVSFTLVDMNSYWPNKYLLVGNVHIHSSDPHENCEIRKLQYDEISQLLKKFVNSKLFPINFSWEKCGFLLMGDFNSSLYDRDDKKIRSEYNKIKSIMGKNNQLVDIINDKLDPNNKTFDIKNKYLSPDSFHDIGIIDYMFSADNYITGEPLLKLEIVQAKINLPEKNNEMSDHYGLETTIIPKYP